MINNIIMVSIIFNEDIIKIKNLYSKRERGVITHLSSLKIPFTLRLG